MIFPLDKNRNGVFFPLVLLTVSADGMTVVLERVCTRPAALSPRRANRWRSGGGDAADPDTWLTGTEDECESVTPAAASHTTQVLHCHTLTCMWN